MLPKIKVSKMNGKLEELQAISTNTRSNQFCIDMKKVKKDNWICSECYSWETLNIGVYKQLEPALQHNSDILAFAPLEPEQMPKFKRKTRFVRLSAHGDLINDLHLENLIVIVNANSDISFGLWSKRADIVKRYFSNNPIPKNLQLVYSNPVVNKIMNKPPAPFHRTFNNVSHKGYLENCTGQKCKDCLLCYTNSKVNVIVEKVK